ncbi:Metal-dependent hydrolase, endonuclease/exonuclease/phosphatase family [Gracilibacillus orientalis]|uniref:Metal-dependent hydrolase, endonuclease/exonuclease/phosphatase family n=1 Tax=Gracilibacillus orientalis TaxID=334253 RepID=A0A1I4L4L5_9BACI|nr:endonuclease/exonuclease/phosphatase family protein [Gracilibacillus orientalis]SFL85819.1 Metal-dependent hydrolase, endonuclease/exonuclease/phosphatase family [Gracilibacillus orientalis]
MHIKVMTYNIHHGKGLDKKVNLHRICDVIANSNADIIGLNEVDRYFSKRSHFLDQTEYLTNELNYYGFFSPSLSLKPRKNCVTRQYGNAILSRFPIHASNSYVFSNRLCFTEDRSILEAIIPLNDKLVHFYVTHLSLNPCIHNKQSEFIINKAKRPAVIIGDWNMKMQSKRWRRVVEVYRDVWDSVENPAGLTYPSQNPRKRLDYMFVSNDIKILDVQVNDFMPTASDHLPLVSTLSI